MKLATKEKTPEQLARQKRYLSKRPLVDPYIGQLFRNYTGVSDQCSYEELVGLAEDFIITIHNDFEGIDIDVFGNYIGGTAQGYANNYLEMEGLTQEDLPNDLN